MALGYMGETIVDVKDTEYKKYTKTDWVLLWIEMYNVDGAHHKDWLLDQIARIMTGSRIIVSVAKWESNGKISTEDRFVLEEPTKKYHEWIKSITLDEDGEEYDYDCGGAP